MKPLIPLKKGRQSTSERESSKPDKGIDKLTCRRGLALPHRRLSALYVDAGAHSECIFTSKYTEYFHIPIAEPVNLSIPPYTR